MLWNVWNRCKIVVTKRNRRQSSRNKRNLKCAPQNRLFKLLNNLGELHHRYIDIELQIRRASKSEKRFAANYRIICPKNAPQYAHFIHVPLPTRGATSTTKGNKKRHTIYVLTFVESQKILRHEIDLYCWLQDWLYREHTWSELAAKMLKESAFVNEIWC